MSRPSLLMKAREAQSFGRHIELTREDVELIVAWLNGEISNHQVQVAKAFRNGGVDVYTYLARGAREIWQNGNEGKP